MDRDHVRASAGDQQDLLCCEVNMSGICGWVGEADPTVLVAMLAAIDYRGDRTDLAFAPGAALGYRWWDGRPGKSPAIHRSGPHLVACAGAFAPPVSSPAAELIDR